MNTVCNLDACTGCMACIGKCKKSAITIKDSLTAYNAVIDETKCVNCGACERVCPNNNSVKLNDPIIWREGWACDNIRMRSSSGGAASAFMKSFIDDGGYVAACLFRDGEFVFDITNNPIGVKKFAGSKYVKSNPSGIYNRITDRLKAGNKVLFIGLPCQVAAALNFTLVLPFDKRSNLYTIDLICHGTPSPKILELALYEKGVDIKRLSDIRFRIKANFGLSSRREDKFEMLTPPRVQDMYTYAFLTGLDYTENCYSCRYATTSRVSDITIGDSWGSELDKAELGNGVSLVIGNTDKGLELIDKSGMILKEVDATKSIDANKQLQYPSRIPEKRKDLFLNLDKGFHKSIAMCLPKVYYKQKLKEALIELKLIRGSRPQ